MVQTISINEDRGRVTVRSDMNHGFTDFVDKASVGLIEPTLEATTRQSMKQRHSCVSESSLGIMLTLSHVAWAELLQYEYPAITPEEIALNPSLSFYLDKDKHPATRESIILRSTSSTTYIASML